MMDSVNVPLLLSTIALAVFGSVMVWSATRGMVGADAIFKRHLTGLAIGLLPLAVMWFIDYSKFKGWTGPLLVGLSLLIISPRIPGLGSSANGATSWLKIGSISLFQPSEPAKLIFIVVLAAVIAGYNGKIEEPRDVLRVAGYAGLPVALILLQPDLGTGLVFVVVALAMLLIGGLKLRWFGLFAVIAALMIVAVVTLPILKTYQKDRLLVFVDPTLDPKGAGYNLAQSKIAIGSGGLTGKGLQNSTQSRLNFIPARDTDFIFSVVGEQLGFLGGVMLLGFYLALLFSSLSIATSSRDLYGALIAAGLIGMWLFQILENAGMTMGLMPITGIPLPFISYGGSFMITNLAGVGMLMSVWSRRYGT
jgi:rod shape determining protein RodA